MTYVGTRVPRLNDDKLLHGTARFLDDVDEPRGTLHAALVRSPIAHGTVTGVDARGVDPAMLDLGPDELLSLTRGPAPVKWVIGDQTATTVAVVDERVRYVGQPVAVAIAASRYAAEDAAEQVIVDYDELPAVTDVDAAVAAGAPLLHPDRGSNVVCRFDSGDTAERTDAVFADADRRLRTTLRIGRLAGTPMETRGILVVPDAGSGKVTVWLSSQAPHAARDVISEVTGLPLRAIRVISPDMGGGFGVKDHIYEDELLVVLAALDLGRPVKWVEDRLESLTVTAQARDEVHDVEVAYDDDGTLRALRIHGRRNVGGHLGFHGAGPLMTGLTLVPGPYRWEAVRSVGEGVATNTTPTGAYRGFGQTQAAAVRERAVDLVARDLGRDPVELREQNMIGADEQPYANRTLLEYDNGDYPRALLRARELIGAGPPPPDDGRARGIGYCSYVHMSGIGPSAANELIGLDIGGFETGSVRVEHDGSVRVHTGITPHGQGQETTFAQVVADELGVAVDAIELIHSDTDHTPYSAYGTAASRSLVVGGGAVKQAAAAVADKMRAVAAEMLEASPGDITLADGAATVAGTQVSVPIVDVAAMAWRGLRLPEGAQAGLDERFAYDPPSCTFSYGTHACRVAVDRATGVVEIEDYVVVHDCGTIVNPTIVEGQLQGGVAQGVGAALLEEVVHSPEGQPLSTTLLDYLLPVASTLPDLRIEHIETPSPHTPGGMKGVGEGGTNGSFACVLNAVAAALPDLPTDEMTTPLTPSRIWHALHDTP